MSKHYDETVFPPEKWKWRELLRASLLELDQVKLPRRIEKARREIEKRIEELKGKPGKHQEERIALQDGLNSLKILARTEQIPQPKIRP